MKARITIPEPCHADWNDMQPNKKGRHCDQCALTVVDFTGWELPDIAEYLQANAGKKVCGRFQAKQIEQSFDLKTFAPQIIKWHTGILRKVAAIIVICFALGSSGCYMGAASDQPAELSGDTVMVDPAVNATGPAASDTATAPSTITPSHPKHKKKVHRTKGVEVSEPTGYTTMGAPMMDYREELKQAPPVKESPKFQPPVGPPEDVSPSEQRK